MALASVIIPTYNRKEVLAKTLSSLANQTLPPDSFEVIVVDNGSTDGTCLLENQNWPWKLTLIRQSKLGATKGRNLGAEISRR